MWRAYAYSEQNLRYIKGLDLTICMYITSVVHIYSIDCCTIKLKENNKSTLYQYSKSNIWISTFYGRPTRNKKGCRGKDGGEGSLIFLKNCLFPGIMKF